MSSIWVFLLVWGVYLITPLLVDVIDAVFRLGIVRARRRREPLLESVEEPGDFPTVSIIVPAHNEGAVIDRCLTSIKNQDYPSDRLEIVVVDDGSTDDTSDRVEDHLNGAGAGNGMKLRNRHMKVGPFDGTLTLIKNGHQGKAHALNAGIAASTSELIINIDSDVVLAPDAVRNIALAFMRDPRMDAATGNIQIDWEILEDHDEDGKIIVDEDGMIVPRRLTAWERFLAKSQFLEYLAAFDLGRRAQAITSTIYTLAGACSAYRRSLIAEGVTYTNTTVSEDTALTFDLHRRKARIGYVGDAHVHLEPVTDLDSLYAQRVRWTRGQLEVCGLNQDVISRHEGMFGAFTLPKMLLYDHTLAFPRLIWAPLFLCFPLIGYSWRVVVTALVAMYLLYLGIEVINTLSLYSVADSYTRSRIDRCGWALLGLPIYRFIVFHFRFSGFLVTLKDKQQWTTSGPVKTARGDFESLRLRSVEFASLLGLTLTRAVRLAGALLGPMLIGLVLGVIRLAESWRKGA
jgi:biofilm PGA synthesis N-glycosyltransferase PgaC